MNIKEVQTLIKVEHLVKRYGNRNVVDDLTFTVEKGQIVGFLGPNGAGKSTTMNMITGYISATDGTIEIDGVDIFDEPEKAKKKIGYLPEMPPRNVLTKMQFHIIASCHHKLVISLKISCINHAIASNGITVIRLRPI